MILGMIIAIFEVEPDVFYLKFYLANGELAYLKVDAEKLSSFPVPKRILNNGFFDVRDLISLHYYVKYAVDKKGVNHISFVKQAFYTKHKLLPAVPVRVESFYPSLSSLDPVLIKEVLNK